jgi:type 1 glutamine amidotransferase
MNKILPLVSLFMGATLLTASAANKRVLLIAGKTSHGPGDHEFRAGCLLLKKCLDSVPGLQVEVYSNGWPSSDSVFQGASAVVIYADGGAGHPAIQGDHTKLFDDLANQGVGIGCMHYAVEVPKGDAGAAMHRWIGGYYEHLFSVNPMWVPDLKSFPDHPVTRGVGPFALLDEWYFNLRGPDDPKGITRILVDKPSDKVRHGPYVYPPGPYDHIVAASGRAETMMWTFERPDGGRGFGFTGGHKHVNWANDNYRKVVLNAILWVAKIDVPAHGVESTLRPEDLALNLDDKHQSADAPNFTGHWACHVETERGVGDPTFDLVHAGQNLLGQYKGRFGEAVVYGTVGRSNSVRFWFNVKRDDQEIPMTYSGQAENSGAMKGKVNFGDLGEGTWTGTKGH